MQNKCIRFCFQLDKMPTISHKEFRDLNWLPVITRFEQCAIYNIILTYNIYIYINIYILSAASYSLFFATKVSHNCF